MWWKVITFVYAFGYLWAVFDAAHDGTAFRLITTALLLPALVSLFLLAFNKHLLPRLFWKTYAIIFVAYWALPLALRCEDAGQRKRHSDLRDNHHGLRSLLAACRAELVVAFLRAR